MGPQTDRLVAKYYRDRDGKMPVRDYVEGLPEAEQFLINNFIALINKLCTVRKPDLPEPYSRHIEGPIRELRPQAKGKKYRIMYSRSERMVILLSIFRKSTDKTPESEKTSARTRWADFQTRMSADPRQPPSPIGTGTAPP